MKKILVFLLFMTAVMSLTSCGSFSNLSYDDAYKYGWNTGVMLRGGSPDEFLK